MNSHFQNLMQEVARLTRVETLQASTAAIQKALSAAGLTSPLTPNHFPFNNGTAREVPQEPTTNASATADRFIAGSFGQGRSHRNYKLYIPPNASLKPLPLVVMLHGCTQNPDDFAAGTRMNELAELQGFYVLYPAQSAQANPQGCWNWFKHTHQQRGRGEAGLLAEMTRHVMAQYAIDSRRVYVAGLSAGGAMAAILGCVQPDLYAAVGVHSGLAAGVANDLPSALSAMQSGSSKQAASHGVPTIVFHGDADKTVHVSNGDQVVAACTGKGLNAEIKQIRQAGTHQCTQRVYRNAGGDVVAEYWLVHGAAHAWSGGSSSGSYTDSRGPDASAELVRFFMEHPRLALQ